MKKGFTLIELLAVIIILSLLLTIVSVSITSIVKKTKQNIYDNVQLESIKKTAQTWALDNHDILPPATTCGYIKLSDLQKLGYIGDNIINSTNLDNQDDFNIRIDARNIKENYLEYSYTLLSNSINDCIALIIADNCFEFSNNTITSYDSSCPKKIALPNKIDGNEVLTIDSNAFADKGLTFVIIPSSIETIKTSAFSNNTNLNVIINNCENNIPGIDIDSEAFPSSTTFTWKYNCSN